MRISALTGRHNYFEDFRVGDVLKHARGKTVEPLEQVWITNVTMNTAEAHFNEHAMKDSNWLSTKIDPKNPMSERRAQGNQRMIAELEARAHGSTARARR